MKMGKATRHGASACLRIRVSQKIINARKVMVLNIRIKGILFYINFVEQTNFFYYSVYDKFSLLYTITGALLSLALNMIMQNGSEYGHAK